MSVLAHALVMPYPGLRPFEEPDHPLFFGREVQVSRTLRQLEDEPFLAVVGASGSGKSSLVRAGLVPAVREGFLLGTDDWLILIVKPGHEPYHRLARALHRTRLAREAGGNGVTDGHSASADEERIVAALCRSDRGLITALDEAVVPATTRVMVVVDQFEELFAFRRAGTRSDPIASRDEAAAFIRMLLRSSSGAQDRVRVILTMRSDFIGDCEAFLGLPEAVSHSQFLVPRLDRRQMEEVITRPGGVEDVAFQPFTFEDGLVNRIVNDAGDRSDQLPLMQHALMCTWKHALRRPRASGDPIRLMHIDYDEAGGIEHALSLHADAAWDEIKDYARLAPLARHLFLLLCDVSSDGQITRRHPRVEEVEAVTGATVAEIESVVRVFQADDRNFLLPPAPQPLESTTLLDISHESLIRQWKKFSEWVADESRSVAMFTRLRDAAMRWPKEEPPLRDPALTLAITWREEQRPSSAWAERYGGGLDRALEYLDRSTEGRRRDEQTAEAARQKELADAQRRVRRFRNTTVVLFAFTLAMAGLFIYARVQRAKAQALSQSVTSLSQNVTSLEETKSNLQRTTDALNLERTRVEGDKKRLDGVVGSLRQAQARLQGQQQQLQASNDAMASVNAASGTVKRSDDGTVAVAFHDSAESPDKVLPLLARIGKVRAVNLSRTNVSDAGLAALTRLPDLKELDLSFTGITNAAMTHVVKMTQLTQLSINDTLITETSLPLLEKLSNLKTVDVSGNRVNQTAVDRLRHALGAQSVVYRPDPLLEALSQYQGSWLQALASVNGTRTGDAVTFFDSTITDSAIKSLGEFRGINLSLCLRVTNSGLKYLGPNLRSLVLYNNVQISDEGVENLAGLTALSSLTLNDAKITDRGLAAVSRLRGLTSLSVDGTGHKITNSGVAQLAALTKLEQLTLNFNWDLTDDALNTVVTMRNLRSITFLGNRKFSSAGFSRLKTLPLLRKLDIWFSLGSKLTDLDLKQFEGFTQLESLRLRMSGTDVSVSEEGRQSLRKALANTTVSMED
ncbi:MAG TPA: AAA family ATPase [Candidatus Acidoferrum sp.]|nr:AAA family ATPase [Candidatus Acidoferrum sp.]